MSNPIHQSQPPQAAVDQIIGLYNQGQLEQTVAFAEGLANQYPSALILYDILGAAYMGLKNTEKTIASYQKALQLNPNHTDAYNNVGMALYDQGRFDEAVESYQKAIKLEPSFADAHYNLGNALKQTGDLKKAIESYRASLAINSDDGEVLSHCGNALKDCGEFDQAIECYAKALKIDPNLTCVQTNMDNAIAEKSKGNNIVNSKAFQNYQRLVQETSFEVPSVSEPPEHLIQELIQYYNLGKFEVVISKAEPLVVLFPKATVILNIMGSSNAGLENYDMALTTFEQALKIKPDDVDVLNNMGNAQKDKGDLNAAIDTFKQALKFKPDNAAVCYNMGVALQEKGNLQAATASYKMATQIKPDFADAYNNMGIVLQDKGDLDAAIRSLRQALKITSDFAEAYLNLGNAQYEKGDLEAATENYKKCLQIRPHYASVWNNLAYTLQSVRLQKPTSKQVFATLSSKGNDKQSQILQSILKYKLDSGSVSAEDSLKDALSLLSTAGNISIENPNLRRTKCQTKPIITEKITALVHFGRSGTGLLHSLIDGHPEISTLPSIYFSEFFHHSTWEKIIAGGWSEMADRFVKIYEVLFNASSSRPVASKASQNIKNLGKKEGMASVGGRRDEVLSVDKTVFTKKLYRLMDFHDRLDTLTFFRLVHSAYEAALDNHDKKNLIFYHIHNPDTYAQVNFLSVAPNASWVMMIREPVQSCEAWIQASGPENQYSGIVEVIFQMLFEVDDIIFRNENSIGLRLEDLKQHPKKTIPALCDWLGIKEADSLYEMTAQGKKWWGDPASPDYAKDGMNPFGKTSINRKVGSVFSENDQFVLRTLFYPFSIRFGYAEENTEQFKTDLKKIRPMLDQMFDFEKKIVLETKADAEQFVKSGSYLYLRSGMIERWNTLNEFHTYPNMIRPLKIN